MGYIFYIIGKIFKLVKKKILTFYDLLRDFKSYSIKTWLKTKTLEFYKFISSPVEIKQYIKKKLFNLYKFISSSDSKDSHNLKKWLNKIYEYIYEIYDELYDKYTKFPIYYTFKESEHEVFFLKKLEDGKIFYDNQIYDKDFFDYEKLESLLKVFYEHRDKHVQFQFRQYYRDYKRYKYTVFKKKGVWHHHCLKVKKFYPGLRDEWVDLTKTQYDILVEAYSFNYSYSGYPVKLTFTKQFYEFGWKSIKPIFAPYKDAHYKHYSDYEIHDEAGMYRHTYGPYEVGGHWQEEWAEYDEEKKFNEFDIYSTTNTYTKYKQYNNIYYKDYIAGEKFSTESAFDFTEEEIKANYDNMVNNKTIDKFTFVMENEKTRRYLFEVREKLLKHERRLINYENEEPWPAERRENYNIYVGEMVKNYRYEYLSDPRNILILPVIDAFIELFRGRANIYGDHSFTDYNYDGNRKLVDMIFLYELTVESQEDEGRKGYFFEEYQENIIIEEEADIKEDAFYYHSLALLVWYWSLFIILYYVGGVQLIADIPNTLHDSVNDISLGINAYQGTNKASIYYELVSRKGKVTVKGVPLPGRFYYDLNYVFSRRHARGMLPLGLWDRVCIAVNDYDFGVKGIYIKLWNFGTKLGYR